MSEMNPINKKENLRLLRNALGLTQKGFIERFLSSEDGKPAMSIATFSNLESKDGVRMNEVILAVSENLGIDSMMFSSGLDLLLSRIQLSLGQLHLILSQIDLRSGIGKLHRRRQFPFLYLDQSVIDLPEILIQHCRCLTCIFLRGAFSLVFR